MTLQVQVPTKCVAVSRYVLSVILGDFLGLPHEIAVTETDRVRIQWKGRQIILPATFFALAHDAWLQPASLPSRPVDVWDVRGCRLNPDLLVPTVPLLWGDPWCRIEDESIELGGDLLGGAFFMLSRYEEAVVTTRDLHGRFPAAASVALQEGFLERPLVNEYVEIVWACVRHLWPELKRPSRARPGLQVTVDVDQPYSCGIHHPVRQLRQCAGDLLRRHDPLRAARGMINYFRSKRGDLSFDPFYPNLDWMMDVNEQEGNRVAFYFLAGGSHGRFDGCYSLDEPIIRALLRRIDSRGHEIGIHPSYETFLNPDLFHQELDALRRVLDSEGIQQPVAGGRQHYLRWETPTTARLWDEAGLEYDSSLAFADHAGFRCGTCYEYRFFDLHERRPLGLTERPLIVMDVTVLSRPYMNLGATPAALETIENYRRICEHYDGQFVLLWHNSFFDTAAARAIYRQIIRPVSDEPARPAAQAVAATRRPTNAGTHRDSL